MATVEELLRKASEVLAATSLSARLDSQILLESASGVNRIRFITDPAQVVAPAAEEKFWKLVERRKNSEPVAYLVGAKEFFGRSFVVTPDVLVPRPETEFLVEIALDAIEDLPGEPRILDIGTGSGCIAISIALELRKLGRGFRMTAVDTSEAALKVARENATRLGVKDEVIFASSDWFSAFEDSRERFDVIVSNPPYIAEGDARVSPELKCEPAIALYSGKTGIEAYEEIFSGLPRHLNPGGTIAVETGAGQHSQIKEMVARLGLQSFFSELKGYKDLAGHERVLVGRRG